MPDITVNVTLDTKDLEALARKMNVLPAFKDGIRAGAIYVKGVIAEYPPATDANMPGPYPKRWYVRGKGPHWALKGSGFHFKRTSETLGRRWTTRSVDDGLGAVVGNNASYGPRVQAREYQQRWHKAHGWQTAEDVTEDEGPEVMKKIQMFVEQAITKR